MNRRRLVLVLGAADEGQIGNQVPQEFAVGIGNQQLFGPGKFREVFPGAGFLGAEKVEIGAAEALDFCGKRQRENIHPEAVDDCFRGKRGNLRVRFESDGFRGGEQQNVAFAQKAHRGVLLQRFSRKLQPGEGPSFRRGKPCSGGQRFLFARQDLTADPRQQVTIGAVEKRSQRVFQSVDPQGAFRSPKFLQRYRAQRRFLGGDGDEAKLRRVDVRRNPIQEVPRFLFPKENTADRLVDDVKLNPTGNDFQHGAPAVVQLDPFADFSVRRRHSETFLFDKIYG